MKTHLDRRAILKSTALTISAVAAESVLGNSAALELTQKAQDKSGRPRARGLAIHDWQSAMRRVHSRFTGKPGTLAQFGDSITETRAFWSPLSYERKNASPEFEKAFQLVKAHLVPDTWTGGKGPENGNQGGKTVAWALENLDGWLKRLNPEIAVILFGTNDLSSVEIDDYRKQLSSLVRKCLERGTVVLLTTVPPRHGFEKKAEHFAGAARSIMKEFSVPLIDLHDEIMRRRPDDWDGALDKFSTFKDYDVPTLISRDGVHPSYPSQFQSDYSAEGLRSSGYTLRNYLTLLKVAEVLQVLKR
jgi:lysophospholipase L1-like esterase